MSRIEEIQARVDVATPGPWTARHRHGLLDPTYDEQAGLGLEIEGPPEAWNRGQFARGGDALFIAHSREDVPWLLARVRSLEAGLAEYGRHREDCHLYQSLGRTQIHNPSCVCSCGLAALANEP